MHAEQLRPSPFPQVYSEYGQLKLAATSRQIANVAEEEPLGGGCPELLAVAHFVDAVLPPDPSWQVGARAGLR